MRRTSSSDDERYDAFQQIEHDLVRDAAPAASMRLYNNRYFFSRRMGCHHYLTVYGIDLAQLCLRPEITTDDSVVYRARRRSARPRPALQRDGRHGHRRLRDR